MEEPFSSSPNTDSEPKLKIEQNVEGDRNQSIGQVLGGMVVYGTVIYPPAAPDSATNQTKDLQIGANPYQGLLAFGETDGDRFFGRSNQIKELWNKFRRLHEKESATRLLTIYGPSGSGKSSLARAGLIPELSRRPLPGGDVARVAVLVPGSHPLESLATVLARVATNDPTPVTKTREFVTELSLVNAEEVYDGLRRIVDTLPEIASSPLIVLVDQLEELFTLCEDPKEREAFVGNLLSAVADRAKRVSAIFTLRSDFLEATQKHPLLNQLIAAQGYLVAAMNEDGLREAIAKPAESAGHSLDLSTVNLLIVDTADRAGALPLLQFALTRIWAGLAAGKEPAKTLKDINGVGGALAEEAKRIYKDLTPNEQKIARRVFLGLVHLAEGVKDTRRRIKLERVVAHRDSLEQVQKVIDRFASPSTRLITLADDNGTKTVEVTHEALFDNWPQLKDWLNENREDLRFQRRLDDAANDWQDHKGRLWRSPDLDLLRSYQERVGDEMTDRQKKFYRASINDKNYKSLAFVSIVFVFFALIVGLSASNKTKDDLYEKYAYCPEQEGRPGENVGGACFRNLKTSGDVIVFLSSTNSYLQKGVKAFKDKEFDKAIELFENAANGDHSDPVSRIFLNNAKARKQQSLGFKPLKIAVVASIDYHEIAAKEVLRGVADAQDEFNKNSVMSGMLEVVIANDENNVEAAQKVAQKLVEDGDILGVIGHHSSESTFAAQKIYTENKIALISPTSSSAIKGDQFFRTVGSTKESAQIYVNFIKEKLNLDKIIVFYDKESGFSKQFNEDFQEFFKSNSIKNNTAMKIRIEELGSENIDEIFSQVLADHESKGILIASGVKNDSIAIAMATKINKLSVHQEGKTKLLGVMTLSEQESRGKGGYNDKGEYNMNGMLLVRPCLVPTSKPVKIASEQKIKFKDSSWIDRARKRWSLDDINWRHATSYDATIALTEAIKRSKNKLDRNEVITQLHLLTLSEEETSGFGLEWDKDEHHNKKRGYCVVENIKGKFVEKK
jgi:ABC-type branched-subunit amino acid transport system substrate-binding protein